MKIMNNMKEDEGFFGGLFDLNGDGKLDDSEKIMDFLMFEDLMEDEDEEDDDDGDDF